MNEYIVTCRSYEDLENLYDDMRLLVGLCIFLIGKLIWFTEEQSVTTLYMLTEEEAAEIRNDERVIACERLAKDRGIVPDYLWTRD